MKNFPTNSFKYMRPFEILKKQFKNAKICLSNNFRLPKFHPETLRHQETSFIRKTLLFSTFYS